MPPTASAAALNPLPKDKRKLFKWRLTSGFAAVPDAQAVGEELERLEIQVGDQSFHRAADVVQIAKNKASSLHPIFPWDDTIAAREHRLNIARSLLRNLAFVVVGQVKREKIPVYLHVRDAEGPRYVRTEDVINDDELRARAIDEIVSLLGGIERRLRMVEGLEATIADDLESIRKKLKKKRKPKK